MIKWLKKNLLISFITLGICFGASISLVGIYKVITERHGNMDRAQAVIEQAEKKQELLIETGHAVMVGDVVYYKIEFEIEGKCYTLLKSRSFEHILERDCK